MRSKIEKDSKEDLKDRSKGRGDSSFTNCITSCVDNQFELIKYLKQSRGSNLALLSIIK